MSFPPQNRNTSIKLSSLADEYDASEATTAVNLSRDFDKLRKDGTPCDVTLRIGERTLRAHKIVVCESSSYFGAMFSGNFTESNQEEISIKDVDADFVELLIDYMYTGKLDIDLENVKALLLTAAFLQITSVEKMCCSFILDQLNRDNCIEYLLFSENTSISCLFRSSFKKVVEEFPYIFGKNDYLELDFEKIKQITLSLKSKAYPEDVIFAFTTRWIQNSGETRLQFLEELLQLMNPLLVSPSVLRSTEFASNPRFRAWAGRNTTFYSSNETDDYILISRTYGKICPTRMKMTSNDERCLIQAPPGDPIHGSYTCRGYYIFHQGGLKHHNAITESYAYNQTERVWVPYVPLREARAWHRSVVLNEKFFSVGGNSTDARTLESVEFTDFYSGRSAFTNPLPHAKERPGLAVHENTLYIVGGSNREINYACTHRLDERVGVWQDVAPLPCTGSASSCAVIGDEIYTTTGGILQRYDIRANHWEQVLNQDERYLQDVFTVNNILFGAFYKSLARYIPEEGRWEDHRPFKHMQLALDFATNLLIPNVPQKEYNCNCQRDDKPSMYFVS